MLSPFGNCTYRINYLIDERSGCHTLPIRRPTTTAEGVAGTFPRGLKVDQRLRFTEAGPIDKYGIDLADENDVISGRGGEMRRSKLLRADPEVFRCGLRWGYRAER